jgi:predicted site-specific integrase-resolvase
MSDDRNYFSSSPRRCYTAKQICESYQIGRSTFFDWKKQGKLPLVEVRIGRTVRYQAAPIDRHLAGKPLKGR